MSVRRRALFLGASALAIFVWTALSLSAAVGGRPDMRLQDAPLEERFVAAINVSRAQEGLAPLRLCGDLSDDARAQTARMMAAERLFHSDDLRPYATGWSLLGENVGLGPEVGRLNDAFMASPAHRKNVLDDFDRVGVGADRDEDGIIFVTVLFMRTALPDAETLEARRPQATGLAWSLIGLND